MELARISDISRSNVILPSVTRGYSSAEGQTHPLDDADKNINELTLATSSSTSCSRCFSTRFSPLTNWSFSLRWVSTCTVLVILARSFASSCTTPPTLSSKHLVYAVITIAIRLRSDYDVSRAPASIRREQKTKRQFFVVVVSQSNRTHIVIAITFVVVECVVVSSYSSRIVVESQCDIGFRQCLDYENWER